MVLNFQPPFYQSKANYYIAYAHSHTLLILSFSPPPYLSYYSHSLSLSLLSASQRSSPPLTSPRVVTAQTEIASSHKWLYTVKPNISISSHGDSSNEGRRNAGLILKIASPQSNHISYHWQVSVFVR